jgi:hypothetical protein
VTRAPAETRPEPPVQRGDAKGPAIAPSASSQPSETPRAPEPPALHPFHEPLPSRVLPKDAPAMRNANLSPAQCRRELQRRKLSLKRQARGAPGVADEYRISGPLSEVTFVSPRTPSPYGVLDCRLGLTLDDLAQLLSAHGVARVRIDNMYRPGARLPGSRKKSQHGYGLAMDVVEFTLQDSVTLSVEGDWGSGIGSTPCGPEATLESETEASVALRNLVCAIARSGIFHHMLTPSYDQAHHDHLHLDIARGEKTMLFR